jgi:hypothetical protein
MSVRVLILATGLLAAVVARRFITNWIGLTYTTPNETRYVPLNVVVFWLLIFVAVVLCLLHWLRRMKAN